MAARKRKTDEDIEGYGVSVGDVPDQPDDEPTPEPQASGDPGQCGETPCWSRTPISIAHSAAARVVTFDSGWSGGIVYDFGDGTKKKSRGTTKHTYAAAGTYSVKATPVASSCATVSPPLAVTVA